MATTMLFRSVVSGTTLQINGGAASGGVTWQVRQISGWVSAAPSLKQTQRMATGGVVVTNAQWGARRILVTGTAYADATSNLWDGFRALEDAVNWTTANGLIQVADASGSTHTAFVRLAAPVKTQLIGPRVFGWSVAAIAPAYALSTST